MSEAASTSHLHKMVVIPSRSRVGQFFEGILVPWLGLKVLIARPQLWGYAIIPVLLNIAIMLATLFAIFAIGSGILTGLWFLLGGEWNSGWWLLAKIAILIVGLLSTIMICIAAAVIMWRFFSAMFCGYFYGKIAMAVERELGLSEDDMRAISMVHEIRDAAIDMGWLLISLAIALLVSLIPFIGAPVALAYSLYFQILTCGRDQFSFPLSLRGKGRAERIEFCREHLPHTMGVGTVVLVMEFIPIIGAIFMVTAAAGTVVLHRRLLLPEEPGAIPAGVQNSVPKVAHPS